MRLQEDILWLPVTSLSLNKREIIHPNLKKEKFDMFESLQGLSYFGEFFELFYLNKNVPFEEDTSTWNNSNQY